MNDVIALDSLTVIQLIERWPQTIAVFQQLRTACVGCAVAPFCTLADVARDYSLSLEALKLEFEQVISAES